MSFGICSTIPRGAVVSTWSTPMPNRIVSQSGDTPQSFSSACRNLSRNAATMAPVMLYAPPISTTASSVIESAVENVSEFR